MPKKRDLSGIFAQIKKANESNQHGDFQKKEFKPIEHLFHPKFKDGKCQVVIRFLPPNVNEYLATVENWSHIKKGFGCDCLEKFGKTCPICEHNHAVRKRYPKTASAEELAIRDSLLLPPARKTYFCNILVVKNENEPETEGKVFRYQFGTLIMSKINERMSGYEDSEEGWQDGINVFHWQEGANFTIEGVDSGSGYGPDYKNSKFGKPKPINRYDREAKKFIPLDTAEQDAIEAQLYTLDEIAKKEDDCKNYEQICEYANRKLGVKLWYLNENGDPVNPNGAATEANAENYSKPAEMDYFNSSAKSPVATSKTNESTASAKDDFIKELADGDVTEESNTESSDKHYSSDDDFYSEMENM
jgi:hypothetical protein